MNEKEKRLADFCKRHGFEGAWLRRRANIAWLTDGADVHVDGASALGVASVLWTPGKKVVLCDNIESPRMAEEEFGRDWEVRASCWWEAAGAPKGRFATDWPVDAIAELRFPLTAAEVKRIRALGKECAGELAAVARWARRGWTEHRVAGELAGRLRARAIFAPVLLVASDRRADRYRHPIPTSKTIDRKFMLVACGQRDGLIVALTRMVHFGKLQHELRRKHDAVCRIDAALHAATAPGRRWCDILAEGIRIYRETGFADEWKRHHQGGPMGYQGRDFKATPSETRCVVKNQAVGWNPSIAGTKSEDTILSTGEVLTETPDWPLCVGRPDILVR